MNWLESGTVPCSDAHRECSKAAQKARKAVDDELSGLVPKTKLNQIKKNLVASIEAEEITIPDNWDLVVDYDQYLLDRWNNDPVAIALRAKLSACRKATGSLSKELEEVVEPQYDQENQGRCRCFGRVGFGL